MVWDTKQICEFRTVVRLKMGASVCHLPCHHCSLEGIKDSSCAFDTWSRFLRISKRLCFPQMRCGCQKWQEVEHKFVWIEQTGETYPHGAASLTQQREHWPRFPKHMYITTKHSRSKTGAKPDFASSLLATQRSIYVAHSSVMADECPWGTPKQTLSHPPPDPRYGCFSMLRNVSPNPHSVLTHVFSECLTQSWGPFWLLLVAIKDFLVCIPTGFRSWLTIGGQWMPVGLCLFLLQSYSVLFLSVNWIHEKVNSNFLSFTSVKTYTHKFVQNCLHRWSCTRTTSVIFHQVSEISCWMLLPACLPYRTYVALVLKEDEKIVLVRLSPLRKGDASCRPGFLDTYFSDRK